MRGAMFDEDVFKLLESADWGEIGNELLSFAATWSKRYPTLGYGEDPKFLVLGVSYEDVVQEVIVKVFSGQRKWDPGKVDLLPWLKMHIKSIIDALAKSSPANQETTLGDGEENDFESGLEYSSVGARHIANSRDSANPEQTILEKEAVDKHLQLIREAAEGDEELEMLILAIECGCDPRPRFLAEELGIPVKDVYQQTRRLQRHIDTLKVRNERAEAEQIG